MWCPVFLQTEDKVGVSALTESWTCFRPYTDHMSSIHKHKRQHSHASTPHTEPCARLQIYNTNMAKYFYPDCEGTRISLFVELGLYLADVYARCVKLKIYWDC